MRELIKIFVIMFLVMLIGILIVDYFVSRPIKYIDFSACSFSCEIPDGAKTGTITEYGWHKHIFQGPGTIYISHMEVDKNPDELFTHYEQFIQSPVYTEEIKIFDNGKFYLIARGKNYRCYIYLFTVGNEIFWIEDTVKNSSILRYKHVVDHLLLTFSWKDQRPSPDLAKNLKATDAKIFRWTQDLTTLLFLILGLIAIIFFVTTVCMMWFAKVPALPNRMIRRKAEGVYIYFKGPFLTRKGTLGWVVLTDTSLIIKPLAYKKQEISGPELDKVSLESKGSRQFLKVELEKWTYHLHLPDTILWEAEIREMDRG